MHNINIILDHVYKRNKISNNVHITNLKKYFFTNNSKIIYDKNVNIRAIIRLNKNDVQNILEETCVYNFDGPKVSPQPKFNSPVTKQQPLSAVARVYKTTNQISVPTYNAPTRPVEQNDYYKLHSHCKDTLYWNMYILKYGYLEYINIHHRYGNVLLDDKINMSIYIKKNVALMKLCNIKVTKTFVNELSSSLICDCNTTISVLYAYVVYYKCNIIMLHHSNKFYISFENEMNSRTHVMKFTEKSKYETVCANCTQTDKYTKKQIQFVRYDKPLNGMGTYKMDVLRNYATIMDVDINLKKGELYQSIYGELVW